MVQEYWPTPHTGCIGQKEATVTATATKTMTSTMTKLLATCGLHVATSCCDSLRQNQLQRHSSDCSHWRPRNDSEWRCQRYWTNTLTTKKIIITFTHSVTDIVFRARLWNSLKSARRGRDILVCFCLSDWSYGCRPFTRFICRSFFFVSFCFSFSNMQQTRLTSSLVNFWVPDKVVIDRLTTSTDRSNACSKQLYLTRRWSYATSFFCYYAL